MTTIPQAMLGAVPRSTEMGTGTVTAISATTLTVLARGVQFECAYLDRYTPTVGDLVAFFRQDSTWLVADKLAGVGTNMIQNFSFELGGPNTIPTSWTQFQISGTGNATGVITGYAPDGVRELQVSAGNAAQDTYVYSAPISVLPGQTWAVSALASAVYPSGATPTADAALYGLWFANPTNLYPTTTSVDTLISQVNNVGPDALHSSVSGSVVVPGGAAYMRIATRSISAASISMLWDAVIARRIG